MIGSATFERLDSDAALADPDGPARICVMGTRSLGATLLTQLRAQHGEEIALTAIVEPGDKKMLETCEKNGVSSVPGRKDWWEDSVRWIRMWGVEAILAAHWNLYVPEMVRRATTWGVLAYHPSILPHWRGNESVKDSQFDGVIGGTVYQMDEGLDTGPIVRLDSGKLLQSASINNWTGDPSGMWRECLFPQGLRLLGELADSLCRGDTLEFVPQ